MTFDMDLALRCQQALDRAASERRARLLIAPPETVKMFGHSPAPLDEAEHAAFLVAICKRRTAS